MKRIVLLMLTAIILAGCTSKAYTTSMDAGKAALQNGNYEEAADLFENAMEEKETQDAKGYLAFATEMKESKQLYHDGDFDAAIYSIKKQLNGKFADQLDIKMVKQANALLKQLEQAKALADSINEKLIKGKTLLEQNQFDEAYEVFKEITENTNLPDVDTIDKLAKDASSLQNEAAKKKDEQEKQKQAEEEKRQEEEKRKQEEANKALTPKQAEDLVRQHLHLQSNSNVKVEYDHDADNGDFIIHVYEFVVDNPSTGEGHTATWGWYGVNKKTKAIYDAMQ